MNASAFQASFFYQSLEIELNKVFNLLSGEKSERHTGRMAGRGFDFDAVRIFSLLYFHIHAKYTSMSDNVAGDLRCFREWKWRQSESITTLRVQSIVFSCSP